MTMLLLKVLLLSATVVGCVRSDEIGVIEIEFEADGTVLANGIRFPLTSKRDGGKILEAFQDAQRIRIKNLQDCNFSDLWKMVDHQNDGKLTSPISYEVLVPSGTIKEIKFNGRASDPLWMGRVDEQLSVDIDSKNDFQGMEPLQNGTNTYLQIWCEISSAKGSQIIKIIGEYIIQAGCSSDIYLLPY